jgi:hypothetical protein
MMSSFCCLCSLVGDVTSPRPRRRATHHDHVV